MRSRVIYQNMQDTDLINNQKSTGPAKMLIEFAKSLKNMKLTYRTNHAIASLLQVAEYTNIYLYFNIYRSL